MESFEAELELNAFPEADRPFTGIFIRAPVSLEFNYLARCFNLNMSWAPQIVLSFIKPDPERPIEYIARLPANLLPDNLPYSVPGNGIAADLATHVDPRTVVALRQGRTLLTTFHPELTRDDRFHEYFVRSCVLELPPKA
jgi:5'-phosphate synthase pdxT subunit